MNSNVEGYFIAKVTTNVYDTATRRHLLIPQGSSILGND
jgi:type IV secretory pathway VirB10-like protein